MPFISVIIIILTALHVGWIYPGAPTPGAAALVIEDNRRERVDWLREASLEALVALGLSGYLFASNRSRREERQAALRGAHLLDLVAGNADNLVFLIDGMGKRLYVSTNCLRILGYSSEELMALPYSRLIPDEDRPVLGEPWQSLAVGAAQGEVSHRLRRKDGSVIWVSTTFHRSADPVSGEIRYMAVSCDRTEQLAAEAARTAQDALFRSMFDALPDRLFVHGVREDGRFTVEMINIAAEREFQLDRNRIGDATLEELLPLPVAACLIDGLRASAAANGPVTTEDSRLAELGKTALEFIRVPIRDTSGRVTHIFVSGRDVADRKLRERELAHARDVANQASRVKSEFLANMSHELRTPLNAVIGFSGLIEMQADLVAGQERLKSYATDIRTSGEYLLALINDILDFSKADSGHLALFEDDVDLVAMTASCIRMMAPTAEESHIRITLTGPDTLYVRGDEKRLRQVLLNLLSNALKFTPPHGLVSVMVDGSGGPSIQVRDTGIGIVAANLERVMEPFTQVEDARNRRHEGTGLGLPISKRMAEIHGGTLSLISTVDVGTTVTLRLPKSRARADLDALAQEAADYDDIDSIYGGGRQMAELLHFPSKILSNSN